MSDRARKYFDKSISDRERAIFEVGVALGSIYHQFTGTPICKDDELLLTLSRAIEKSMSIQPYREKVEVKIVFEEDKVKKHEYDYTTLKGSNLDVKVIVRYGNARVIGRLRYIKEMDYNLMYVEKIENL
jgi:hypothetical protein